MTQPSLETLISLVRPPRAGTAESVRRHLDELTKPPGSLGRLEDLACRLAVILGDPPPSLEPRTVFVLAGDHGVVSRGVSAYPPEVTVQMCRNIADGGAAVAVLARNARATVVTADLGVASPVEHPSVVDLNVLRGTADLASGPAMTVAQTREAIEAGALLFARHGKDARVVAVGEMGIGNTTPAAALTAWLTRSPSTRVVGRGTGVDDAGLAHKRSAVEQALARISYETSPLEVLAEAGGAEIAGMVGLILAAAGAARPIVLDGFISTAAGLVAARLAPACRDYMFASHRSAEPGHHLLLEALELEPILDLGLRLGEGSGAVLSLPILDGAAAILREMATFSSAGVDGPVEAEGAP